MERNKFKYNIGEVSKISGLSIKALRYYDKTGILVPSGRDEINNYRYYLEEQILQALTIQEMRLRGFSIDEMKKILRADSLQPINQLMDQKIQKIQSEMEALEKQKKLVENSRNLLMAALPSVTEKKSRQAKREFIVSEFPICRCVYSRYHSRIFADEIFWDRFANIFKLLKKSEYTVAGPLIGVFHEHYTRQFFFEEGDLEIMAPVTGADLSNANVKEFGGFLTASTVYVGFYNQMLPEYIALIKWIEENDYEIVGDPMEEYLVEFTHGVSQEEYVTRISFPVRKK